MLSEGTRENRQCFKTDMADLHGERVRRSGQNEEAVLIGDDTPFLFAIHIRATRSALRPFRR